MATTYTLTGKAADLVGEGFAASDLTGYVEASQDVVNEDDVNRQRYGRSPLSFASDGTWTVELVGTGDLVQAYRVVIRTRDRILGVKTIESGWFELESDTDFGEVVAVEVQEVAVAGASAAAAAASAATAATSATAAAAAAAQAVDVSNIAVPDDLVTALVEDDTSDTRAALSATFVPVLSPEAFGWKAIEDGGAPCTAPQLAALLAAVAANKGARILGSRGTYRCDLQINLPHNGAAPPRNYPVILAGQGMNASGQGTALLGGTVWDLRYAGSERSSGTNPDGTAVNLNDAKILTVGLGTLQLEDCTLTDLGTSSAPFVHSTYTTIRTRNLGVVGNPSKARETCDQDVFILGGQSIIEGNPTTTDPDAPFQGYGTRIEGVYANRIRRLVLGQIYCNAIVVRDNTVWAQSGNPLPNGAAIEFRGAEESTCSGNVVSGNLIEMVGYPCGIGLYNAVHTGVVNNPLFDGVPGTRVAGVYCGPAAQFNYIEQGFSEDNYPGILEHPSVAYSNTFRTSHQAQLNIQPQPVRHYAPVEVIRDGGSGPVGVDGSGNRAAMQAVNGGPGSTPIAYIRTAPADLVSDGVTTNGSRTVTSAAAGFTTGKHRGQPISGTGIPFNAVIVSVTSTTSVEISDPATSSGTGRSLKFGNAQATPAEEIGFSRRHIVTTGSIGSVSPLGAINGTAEATGTDSAFQLTVTTGATGLSAGDIAVVGAGITWGAPPKYIIVPRNAAAAALATSVYLPTKNSTNNTWITTAVAPPASTTLIWDLIALQ